jgi:hypothetical protein
MEDSKITYNGPALTYFDQESSTFYIQDAPAQVYNIRLGTTVKSNVDRTVKVNISSNTAQKGVQYDYTTTDIVIKANEYIADIPIEGIYSGFAAGNVDTLVVSITEGDIKKADFKQSFSLVMRKYCPVDLNDLYGIWEARGYGIFDDEYIVEVMPNPNGGDTIVLRNLLQAYELGLVYPTTLPTPDVKIVLDYSDPANFTASFADDRANLYIHASPPFSVAYGQAWAQQTKKGVFSSCNKTMSLYFDRRVSAGTFGPCDTDFVWIAPLP